MPEEEPIEWNEKQYAEGHWTGGKIPPLYKYGRGKLLGLLFLFLGLGTLLVAALGCFPSTETLSIDPFPCTNNVLKTTFTGLIGLLWIIAGIRVMFRKPPRPEEK